MARGRTKAVALKRLKDKKLEYERSGRMPSQTTPYLKDWLDRWLDEIVKPRLRPSTLATYRSVVEALIKPAIGGVRLGRLEPKHFRMMEEYITKGDDTCDPPRRPRSSATAGSAWRTLHKALDDAVREGIIESNPCDRAESPRVVYTERKILTPAQAGQLINAENDVMWHLMWRLAYETGMRQGERLGLTNSEIQLIDNVICIVVEWQLKVYNNVKDARDIPSSLGARHVMGKAYLVPPKTNAGRRVIPLPESLAAELGLYIKGTGSMPGVATMRDDDRAMLWRRQCDRIEHPADHMRRAHHQSGKHGDTCQYGNHRHNGSGQPSSSFAPVHLTPRFHISPRDIVAPTPLVQVIIGRAAVFGAFEGKNQGDPRHSFTTASHMRWIGRR